MSAAGFHSLIGSVQLRLSCTKVRSTGPYPRNFDTGEGKYVPHGHVPPPAQSTEAKSTSIL